MATHPRQTAYLILVIMMCLGALALIGGGVGWMFISPDNVSNGITMITIATALFPVAYIFKRVTKDNNSVGSTNTSGGNANRTSNVDNKPSTITSDDSL